MELQSKVIIFMNSVRISIKDYDSPSHSSSSAFLSHSLYLTFSLSLSHSLCLSLSISVFLSLYCSLFVYLFLSISFFPYFSIFLHPLLILLSSLLPSFLPLSLSPISENPSSEECLFIVSIEGPGLLGENFFRLPPKGPQIILIIDN